MKEFYFYDWDWNTNEDYDLTGEDYRELITFCFSHSATVSFHFRDPKIAENEFLQKFLIPCPKEIDVETVQKKLYGRALDFRFYRSCPELCNWMKESAEGMFEWIDGWGYHNPEDPIFYREDGSILFQSIIHEGVLTLSVHDFENCSSIVSKKPWTTARITYSPPPPSSVYPK